jgi:predicted DsbA family dithiol-disulfide isomerase
LKKEFAIEDEWVPFQLRPQTPPDGIPFSVLFPDMDMKERYASLNKAGAPFGITFGERTFLSNSGPALEACELARDNGKYDSFHERLFRAYFTDLLDIGDMTILCKLAEEEGLDPAELSRCLQQGLYLPRIEESMRDAALYGITAVPTFIINEAHRIVGALSLGSFRNRLERIQGEGAIF